MGELLTQEITEKIREAENLYYRLVLVVGPSGAGKTNALQDLRDRTGAHLVNVNLELSRRMLELTERQRALRLPGLLREVIENGENPLILLDNLELVFDVGLNQDPLRLLQGLSRNNTVVAAWNGTIIKNSLVYASPAHPEYRRYPIRDFLMASPEMTA